MITTGLPELRKPGGDQVPSAPSGSHSVSGPYIERKRSGSFSPYQPQSPQHQPCTTDLSMENARDGVTPAGSPRHAAPCGSRKPHWGPRDPQTGQGSREQPGPDGNHQPLWPEDHPCILLPSPSLSLDFESCVMCNGLTTLSTGTAIMATSKVNHGSKEHRPVPLTHSTHLAACTPCELSRCPKHAPGPNQPASPFPAQANAGSLEQGDSGCPHGASPQLVLKL